MRRRFADLHLRFNPRDETQAAQMFERASDFGYRMIGVTTDNANHLGDSDRLRRLGKDFGLDVVTRLDLRAKSGGDLVRSLRRVRRRFELIAVVCDSKPVARQAAKDRRVDLLNFCGCSYRQRFFDLSEAGLASKGLSALEVDIRPLLVMEGPGRAGLLMSLRREVAIARSMDVPVVLSSGVSEVALMRGPDALVALSSLFDLNHSSALSCVSDVPFCMVKRNRSKLSSKFVAPGIRIIREGKGC